MIRLWLTRSITNGGHYHKIFEKKLSELHDGLNVVLYNNGHTALEAALIALELKGEVITTPFTFSSTTQAIVRCGLQPVFCDINETLTMDPKLIENLITKDTSAILCVNVYGIIPDFEAINNIALKHNLKVIYDNAHGFGSRTNGVPVAGFGDFSMLSFHATKIFHTIEGGALVFKDSKYKQKLEVQKNFGLLNNDIVDIGFNGKMNEFQAIMGLLNLKSFSKDNNHRQRLFNEYKRQLILDQRIELIDFPSNLEATYSYFPILLIDPKVSILELIDYLDKNGVMTRRYFYPLTSKIYATELNYINTPIAHKASQNTICLPLYNELTIKNVIRISKIVNSYWREI